LPAVAAEATFRNDKRTYAYGAHAAEVAVDPSTGAVDVLDYVAVEDVGRIINPLTLHGQALGAIVQGLGGALFEELVHDSEGQLLGGNFADYLMPTATDVPAITAVVLESKPSPINPLGAKGAGEGGIVPVGGVIANGRRGGAGNTRRRAARPAAIAAKGVADDRGALGFQLGGVCVTLCA